MGVTLTQLQEDTNRYFKHSTGNLSQVDRNAIIDDAIRKYSQERPLNAISAKTGASDAWYSLPSGWEEGFSVIKEIEYPVESTPKEIIKPEYFDVQHMLVSGSTVQRLRFDLGNPSLGETFWIKYTKRHVIDDSGDSDIPTAHRNAVAYLSVSLMCQAMADFFGGKSDTTLTSVDFVDQPSRVEEWEGLAKIWLKKYHDEITQEVTGIHGQIDFSQDMYHDRNME
jgi:hypothetical protein